VGLIINSPTFPKLFHNPLFQTPWGVLDILGDFKNLKRNTIMFNDPSPKYNKEVTDLLKKLKALKSRINLNGDFLQVTEIQSKETLWISTKHIVTLKNEYIASSESTTVNCKINDTFIINNINAEDLILYIRNKFIITVKKSSDEA
jgi:hypothetical protein